jgi:hypothetical protein
MRKSLLAAIALITVVISNAQSFIYTPEQHRIDTVIMENYEAYDINFTTSVPEQITYKWVLLSNTLPASWTYSICYQGGCATGIPTTVVTMETITLAQAQQGVQGFLKINVTTGLNYGSGKAVFYVYDANDINRGDTVSFDIRWQNLLSTNEINFESQFSIYPNPANDVLIIRSEYDETSEVAFTNAIGEVVLTEKVNVREVKRLDISDLSQGIYFMTITSEKRKLIKKVIVN